jgi:hypothetical protein
MAVPGTGSTNQTLTFIAAKKLSGKATTSNLKEIYNETIPSAVQLKTNTIFGEVIPQTVSPSLYTIVSGTVEYVEFYVRPIAGTTYDANEGDFGDVGFGGGDEAQSAGAHGYQLYLTSSYESLSSNPKAGTGYFTNNQLVNASNGALQLVNPSFGPQTGNNYGLQIYTGNPNDGGFLIPTTSPIEWTPDYFNGTVFVQDYISSAVPRYARGWIYIGKYADEVISLSTGSAAAGGGTNQVQLNNGGLLGGSPNFTFNSDVLNVNGGIVHNRVPVSSSYTASANNYIIAVTDAPTSISLNASSFTDGQVVVIKDESGNVSSANPITLNPSGSQTIDGAPAIYIESPYGSVLLYTDGSDWFIY